VRWVLGVPWCDGASQAHAACVVVAVATGKAEDKQLAALLAGRKAEVALPDSKAKKTPALSFCFHVCCVPVLSVALGVRSVSSWLSVALGVRSVSSFQHL